MNLCMSARLLSVNSEEDSLAIESFSRIAKKYIRTKGDLPNLYLLGILQILLAKYCEAKALDLGNRLMALHQTEDNTEEGDKDWCLGKKEREKVDGKKNPVAL